MREVLPINSILLAVVMIVIAIYAVLGVSFFMELDPKNFATFGQAMFTMFQVRQKSPEFSRNNPTRGQKFCHLRASHVHHVSGTPEEP